MSAEIDAIRKRWRTDYDRGAHDYTDAGCRVLAEHAFRDVHTLLALLPTESAPQRTTPAPKVVGGTGIHSPSELGAALRPPTPEGDARDG